MSKTLLEIRNETLGAFTPEQTAAHERTVRWLKRSGVCDQALRTGAQASEFVLPDSDGRLVSSRDLLDQGPMVLSFFRGDWCTFCTTELCVLQAVQPRIRSLNASLVAITPDTGDFPRALRRNYDLDEVQILSDVDYGVSLAFGVIYSTPREVREYYRQCGVDLPERHGTPAWMLPIPATYIVDQQGIIRSAFVEPDFTLRQEPAAIVELLRGLVRRRKT
jgi:peroxiredoxin